MRLKSIQIAAGLGAAVAFVLATMAAGALLLSLLFALVGAALIAWIAYGVAREFLERRSNMRFASGRQPARPPAP